MRLDKEHPPTIVLPWINPQFLTLRLSMERPKESFLGSLYIRSPVAVF